MRNIRRTSRVATIRYIGLATTIAALLAWPAQGHAQYSAGSTGLPSQSPASLPNHQPSVFPAPDAIDAENPMGPMNAAHRLKLQNDDRHKRLLADTQKLLALATQLRDEVQKSGKDELNVDVVKKAGEMEKLSHDIKDRMRY